MFGDFMALASLRNELEVARRALAAEQDQHARTHIELNRMKQEVYQRKHSSLAASSTENDAYRGTMRAIGEVAEMFIPGEYTINVAARIAKLAKEKR